MTKLGLAMCSGEGKAPVYKQGCVHPFCPDCGRDLSVQGKHQRVVNGKIKRHKRASEPYTFVEKLVFVALLLLDMAVIGAFVYGLAWWLL